MCTKSLAAVRQTAQSARGSTGSCGNRSPRSWWGNLPETRRRWPRVRFPPTSPPTFCSGRRPTRSLRSCRTPHVVIGRRSWPAAAARAPDASAGVAKRSRDLREVATTARGYAPQHATRAAEAKEPSRASARPYTGAWGPLLPPSGTRLDLLAWTPAPRGREPAPSSSTSYGIDRGGDAVRDVELARARPTIVPSATHTASPTSTLSARLASESTPV